MRALTTTANGHLMYFDKDDNKNPLYTYSSKHGVMPQYVTNMAN